jgi:murein DD-endopeptidase MepM/ murein hydrolase activator NlpD
MMESMLRWLAGLLFIAALAAGGAYVVAGRGAPPTIVIAKPDHAVGQSGTLEVVVKTARPIGTVVDIALEQNGRSTPLPINEQSISHPDPNTIRLTREIGKKILPELQQGPAKIVVTAKRWSFLNLRQLTSATSRDFQVRLEPPRVSVLSTKHYVNLGGSEMVVYKASPADVQSGVRVGNVEYTGFPAAGMGMTDADPVTRVAFFALLHDQDLNTRIEVFARDEAGNQATASFVDNVFPKPFKKSRIPLDDKFINRVVPEILEHSPEMKIAIPAQGSPEMLQAFLKINGELRKINADQIAALAAKTSPTRLWEGPFTQLGNSQVEASFADHRTYLYNGKEVDQQTHLGFDLAVTAHVPVLAANNGVVVNASWLGIYGNCVVIDHGLGVQTLYGHLQSFDVKVGDKVTRGQQIGRSDSTGLAGGDHVHFTQLVGGRMVNPVEWWDAHWIADRIERKLRPEPDSAAPARAPHAQEKQRRQHSGKKR